MSRQVQIYPPFSPPRIGKRLRWRARHKSIDLFNSKMSDIVEIYIRPLESAFTQRTLNQDVSVIILRDFARIIKHIFGDEHLDDIDTHTSIYNYFNGSNSFYVLDYQRVAGKALCLIYYLIDLMDEASAWDISTRDHYITELTDLVEMTRCMWVIDQYHDNIIDFVFEGESYSSEINVFTSDRLSELRMKYAKNVNGGRASSKAEGIGQSVGIDNAIQKHLEEGLGTPRKIWMHFRNNHSTSLYNENSPCRLYDQVHERCKADKSKCNGKYDEQIRCDKIAYVHTAYDKKGNEATFYVYFTTRDDGKECIAHDRIVTASNKRQSLNEFHPLTFSSFQNRVSKVKKKLRK